METFCDQCKKLKKDIYKGRCQDCYRKNLIKERQLQAPQIKCACGCGELIPSVGKNGLPQTYKNNHHSKGENNGNYKRGWFITQGYKKLTGYQGHPNASKKGEIREQILVMSQFLGRPLTKTEVVHHKNEDKLDNRIENLELTDRSKHQNIHNPKKGTGKDWTGTVCIECNGETTYPDKNGNPHWMLHPVTKKPYVCMRCYRRIKSQIQVSVLERRTNIDGRVCVKCGVEKSESKSGQSTWHGLGNGKYECKRCYDIGLREKKKQLKTLQAPTNKEVI